MNKLAKLTTVFASALAFGASSSALAASAGNTLLDKAAAVRGWGGGESVEILRRATGPGLSTTHKQLKDALGISGQRSSKVEFGVLQARGDDWKLLVWDDGNAGAFRRNRAGGLVGIERSAAPTKEQMIESALQIVRSKLGSTFSVADGETLVPISVRGEFAGTQSNTPGSKVAELMEGWEVTFGRAIAGHLVVGGASRVRVGFDVRGELESLFFDWPSYVSTKRKEATATPEKVGQRAVAKRGAIPAKLQLQSESIECGYYDSGARRGGRGHGAQDVAPGCVVKSLVATAGLAPGNSEKSGLVNVVSALEVDRTLAPPAGMPAQANEP